MYPSASAIPIDHGIKTISKYKYIHDKRTRPYAINTKYYPVVTSSTPNPAPTPAVHKYVTDVAELISASADTRKMFLTEVTKKCLEMAKKEKDSKQQSEVKLPQVVTYPNYGHGQILPSKESDVLDKRVDVYTLPTTNTTSSITSTVMGTSTSSDTVTSTVTTAPIRMTTPERRDPPNVYKSGYNTSGAERRRFEEGKPNQALTLFAPVGMAEDLTKTQLILCCEDKTELKSLKESIAAIPFQELNRQVIDVANNLKERMSVLENTYQDLKELILQRTIQQSRLDPSLLKKWNPVDMVLKYSPWTSMWLILKKIADDNISDLFPTDWQPRSQLSNIQEKHFKVLTEVMTEMFIQCGLLIEENVTEMDNYQGFLKVLHHHSLMGNISNTEITHFIMLMVYMSLCRQQHYTEY